MLHIWKCKNCGKDFQSYCGEHLNYTEEGYKIRRRQIEARLCVSCFGETPELAKEQMLLPCFNPYTGDIEARDSSN